MPDLTPRLVLLVRCTLCEGELLYTNSRSELCNCPRCEQGWQSAAVPLSVVLSIYAQPGDHEQLLREHIRTQESTGHTLLSHDQNQLSAAALAKVRQSLPKIT